MFEKSIDILIGRGVRMDRGLTMDEIILIEKQYNISIPGSLKNFYMEALPISKGFYNWRSKNIRDVEMIKTAINRPFLAIYTMAEDVYWCESWGEEPYEKKELCQEVRKRLENAPKLIPIYSHRYMPILLDDNPPILSIHDLDIVYYGEDLEDYLNIEFGGKKQNDIHFGNIARVPFWSDIM